MLDFKYFLRSSFSFSFSAFFLRSSSLAKPQPAEHGSQSWSDDEEMPLLRPETSCLSGTSTTPGPSRAQSSVTLASYDTDGEGSLAAASRSAEELTGDVFDMIRSMHVDQARMAGERQATADYLERLLQGRPNQLRETMSDLELRNAQVREMQEELALERERRRTAENKLRAAQEKLETVEEKAQRAEDRATAASKQEETRREELASLQRQRWRRPGQP